MSKVITIQIDGEPQTMEAKKINTPDIDQWHTGWVPADEVDLADLSVHQNGNYVAEEDGLYGYSRIEVDVPTETDSIEVVDAETGTRYRISVDEQGNLVKEVIDGG
jgi:hypothetical protein